MTRRTGPWVIRRKPFEIRESKYVRRDLLKQMQKRIQEQKEIQLSPRTVRKRWTVHGICGVALVATAVAAFYCASQVLKATQSDWFHFAPLSASVVLFISTLIYYIKWNDQWFKEHAQAEFRNMRFAADTLRASWLAELLFEWEKEKGTELPETVISRFTQNLFMDERFRDVEHPAEALSQALRSVSNIRIDREGLEVTKAARKPK